MYWNRGKLRPKLTGYYICIFPGGHERRAYFATRTKEWGTERPTDPWYISLKDPVFWRDE